MRGKALKKRRSRLPRSCTIESVAPVSHSGLSDAAGMRAEMDSRRSSLAWPMPAAAARARWAADSAASFVRSAVRPAAS